MLNGTVLRAIAAAQRNNADLINHCADMVESWADQPNIPDVIGEAGSAAWGDVADAIVANNEILKSYLGSAIANPAQPATGDPANKA